MPSKLDVNEMIKELFDKGIIGNTETGFSRISGTTDGLVYTLAEKNEPKYVLKLDHPQQIIMAEQFFHTYRDITLLPKLLYTDPGKAFILYSYIPGTTHHNRGSKINWLTRLVKELFIHYAIDEHSDKWGRLEFPLPSWREFNELSIDEARTNMGGLLPAADYEKVKSLVQRTLRDEGHASRFLLHGDTGVHNFVFDQFALKGIIDPSPMIGPVLYDFLYAFCSSPDDLNLETLLAAYSLLNQEHIERSRLIEEAIIQLYCRIGICSKHHPHDLNDYLKAWDYWKGLVD